MDGAPQTGSFLQRLVGDAVSPVSEAAGRLARAAVLGLLAGLAFAAALAVLTFAGYAWLAPQIGRAWAITALGGAWLLVAIVFAMMAASATKRRIAVPPPAPVAVADTPEVEAARRAAANFGSTVDGFVDPVAGVLSSLGLKTETVALLSAAQVVKSLKPIHLVGAAMALGVILGGNIGKRR
ncbi:MAG: hypothetical protein KGL46_08990 [Hyphomicrobiales bacterium]|nr:hypothetical protein [Hyphomicrobiales bacterium]